jgi:hypothetical protein
MNKLLLPLILLVITLSQPHIIELEKISKHSGDFNINDYTWLAGSWIGDGFGGVSEETWSMPIDGTMMGMYRHYKDGKTVFYEFLLLDENGIRIKHFHPDITAWEEKDDFVEFKMIDYTKDKIEMEGLIFERLTDTEMKITLELEQNGEISTEIFSMKRMD